MRRQLCRNRFSPGRKELGRGQASEGKQHEIPLLIALAIVIVAAVWDCARSDRPNLKEQGCYAVRQSAGQIAHEIEASIGRYYGSAMENGPMWNDGAADYARRFIRMDYREDENAFHRCVDDIRVSGNDLLNLINNVLDPARSESGKAALNDAAAWDARRRNECFAHQASGIV